MKNIGESMHYSCVERIKIRTHEANLNNWNGVKLNSLDVHVYICYK